MTNQKITRKKKRIPSESATNLRGSKNGMTAAYLVRTFVSPQFKQSELYTKFDLLGTRLQEKGVLMSRREYADQPLGYMPRGIEVECYCLPDEGSVEISLIEQRFDRNGILRATLLAKHPKTIAELSGPDILGAFMRLENTYTPEEWKVTRRRQ